LVPKKKKKKKKKKTKKKKTMMMMRLLLSRQTRGLPKSKTPWNHWIEYSNGEQEQCEMAQAFATVMGGHAHHSLDQVRLPSDGISCIILTAVDHILLGIAQSNQRVKQLEEGL